MHWQRPAALLGFDGDGPLVPAGGGIARNLNRQEYRPVLSLLKRNLLFFVEIIGKASGRGTNQVGLSDFRRVLRDRNGIHKIPAHRIQRQRNGTTNMR